MEDGDIIHFREWLEGSHLQMSLKSIAWHPVRKLDVIV
jgi:hypothetical protein